ncbi:hypothetical protein DXM27_02730 [Rhizobium rhizogenes]|uniref:Uncharacterized protein n=1 Tax=Rhizobium rhizogenes TaxID=359 RepID=A0AA88F5G5_RHIRH|nr:hypothetical protein DXM27_02730 [Rhizobium rhizogenes]MQB09172.1 hypothetical protein [Agrobacterium sp. ICMP 6402]NTZ89391.1 hypothetical protein [Agrobacterium tumefaciens]
MVSKIKQILPATENWYRVLGSKGAPQFERVVFWAVINDGEGDVIAGVPREYIGVIGAVSEWLSDVAGYIEVSPSQLDRLAEHPEELDQYNLVWGD